MRPSVRNDYNPVFVKGYWKHTEQKYTLVYTYRVAIVLLCVQWWACRAQLAGDMSMSVWVLQSTRTLMKSLWPMPIYIIYLDCGDLRRSDLIMIQRFLLSKMQSADKYIASP